MPTDPDPRDIPDDEIDTGKPIADKGEVAAERRPTDSLEPPSRTLDGDVTDDAWQPDLERGDMDNESDTQSGSVSDAEFEDTGPNPELDDGRAPDPATRIDD